MKKIFTCTCFWFLILMLFTTGSFAQSPANKYRFQSTLVDSALHKAIAYATVAVTNTSGEVVSTVYSSDEGAFTVVLNVAGEYVMEVTAVGFRQYLDTLHVKQGQDLVKVPTIRLARSASKMQDVTVVTRRQLVEQKPGMLVYNAENDVTNKGGSAADVLRKTPVVSVDARGNITMRGNGKIKILVDGKFYGLMARSSSDALNMMPADVIKSIEVITSPSAKYDAEGAAGVINIITKKSSKKLTGALEIAASNREQLMNPRIAFSKGKLSVNAAAHLHHTVKKELATQTRTNFENGVVSQTLQQNIYNRNEKPHGSAEVKAEYAVDSVSVLNLSLNSSFAKWPESTETDNLLQDMVSGSSSSYHQSVNSKAPYLSSDIHLSYNRKFKKPGQEIFLIGQYSTNKDRENYHLLQTTKDKLLYQEQNNNKSLLKEWIFQTDYIQPISKNGKNTIETGAKVDLRNYSSRYHVDASRENKPELLEEQLTRSGNFDYTQNITAAYALAKLYFSSSWFLQGGARWEGTYIRGDLSSLPSFTSHFSNLVPSATLSKKLNGVHALSLSYTERISRPDVDDLNPNVNNSDPKNITVGNPSLRPETAHQLELADGMTLKNGMFISVAAFYKVNNNAITEVVTIDTNGSTLTTPQNLASNTQFGANLTANFNLSDNWSASNNINLIHLKFTDAGLRIQNEGWTAGINANTTYKLPHQYTLQAFGDFNSRAITIQGYRSRLFFYSFAAKKELPAKAITLSLTIVNPFNRFIAQSEGFNSTAFTTVRDNRFYNRAFKFTVNFEFGKSVNQLSKKALRQ